MSQLNLCIGCGCDEEHACSVLGEGSIGCWWLRFEAETRRGVCSACEDQVKAWDAGERALQLELVADRYYRQVVFIYNDVAGAIAWLSTPQELLGGRIPRDLILRGKLRRVQAVIDQIRAGGPF